MRRLRPKAKPPKLPSAYLFRKGRSLSLQALELARAPSPCRDPPGQVRRRNLRRRAIPPPRACWRVLRRRVQRWRQCRNARARPWRCGNRTSALDGVAWVDGSRRGTGGDSFRFRHDVTTQARSRMSAPLTSADMLRPRFGEELRDASVGNVDL